MGSPSNERPSPFLGLSPYAESDADVFFGRRAERDLVVANLLTSRLTVLYGPSGVGKSSLLHAGVVPRLRANEGVPTGGSRRTIVVVDSWHDDPVHAILTAVAAAAGDDGAPEDAPLDDALATYGEQLGGILLLVLDQFEEYFLYHGGDGDRLRTELPRSLARADIRSRVLISMREDALANLDRIEGSTSPLFGNLVRLGPMSDAAALEAIAKPVEGDGMQLEPGLPERVLRLLHEREPRAGVARGVRAHRREGVEPAYLQLVMRRLWDHDAGSGSSQLRIATLDAMGTLREIVSEHLGAAMDALTPVERRRMGDAFHFLVTPSGAKIAQSRYDLAQLTGVSEAEIAAPLEKLAAPDARILRPVDDSPSYEIFHDVLAQPLLDWQAQFHAARLRRRSIALGMIAAAAAAIVLALVAYILEPGWLQRAELRTVDARFAIRGNGGAEPDIAIVDLDDASLAALGRGGDRIPRDAHARMIDLLRESGATVIAYDVEFLEPTPGDAGLRMAIERAGPQLLLAATRIDSQGQGQVFGRPGRRLSASVGYAGFPLAADGAYRQVDESVGLSGAGRSEPVTRRLRSFAVVAAALAGDPPARFGRAWIDYRGPARTFRYYSFADVLRHPDPKQFAGKVVVVGTSARRQGDVHATAHGGSRVMSGAEIQANAISTLRRGRPLRELPTAGDLALIVLLGLLPALVALVAGPKLAALLTVAGAAAYLVLAQLLFAAGWIVPVVVPLLGLVVSAAGVFAVRAVHARGTGPVTAARG